MFTTGKNVWRMGFYPEGAQIGRHQKDVASTTLDQVQTHGSSDRAQEQEEEDRGGATQGVSPGEEAL